MGLGIFITASEARLLRVPPMTEITRACEFSDNVGFPFGLRRFYTICNHAYADAFTRANLERLWTDAIRKRAAWISGVVFVMLVVAALIALARPRLTSRVHAIYRLRETQAAG